MNKRSLFLFAAIGLLTGLGFVSPCQAGFITTVSIDNNTGIAVDDLETTWTGTGGSIANVVLSAPPGTTMVVGGNTIDITFTNPLPNGGNVAFDFQTLTSAIGFGGGTWSFTTPTGISFTTPIVPTRDKLSFQTAGVVPEPSSMALLGIGMTGFFAFRRFFRRTVAA
jgi:hypothetical protein